MATGVGNGSQAGGEQLPDRFGRRLPPQRSTRTGGGSGWSPKGSRGPERAGDRSRGGVRRRPETIGELRRRSPGRLEAAATIRKLEIAAASQAERGAALDEALRQVRGERDAAQAEKATLASDAARLQLNLKRADEDLNASRKRASRLGAGDSLQKDLAAAAQRAAVAERHAADTEALCDDLKQRCRSLEEDARNLQGEHRALTARLLEAQSAHVPSTETRLEEKGAAPSVSLAQGHERPAKPGNGKSKA